MDEYIVEMRHITKRFPGIIANDDVSISIRRGEVYALLGENGAGKSTLMSMLFGMYEPDQGEILINGKEVRFHSSTDAAAQNIGMVHQHFKLVDNYTIAENIVLGIEPMKKKFGFLPWVDMKEANQKIREISERYGLEVNPTDLIQDVQVSVRQRAHGRTYAPGDQLPSGNYRRSAPGRKNDHPHHTQDRGDQKDSRPLRDPSQRKTDRCPQRGGYFRAGNGRSDGGPAGQL